MTVVTTINNRRILEREPIGIYVNPWWLVELRGPTTNQGGVLVVWRKRDSFAEAVAEAERLGPMTEQPDSLTDDREAARG